MYNLKKIFLILTILVISITPIMAKDINRGIKYDFKDGIYHFTIPANTKIEFVSTQKLTTNANVHKDTGAILTVNTGFFDPKNQKTISFIYNDGLLLESPIENENLIFNETIMDNWDKVGNRTEFRVTMKEHKYHYDIAPHNEPYNGRLIGSAQAGPMLIPNLRLSSSLSLS